MLRSVGQRPQAADDLDPRVAELRAAVTRLRRELAGNRQEFADRVIAEDELAALDAMASSGIPEVWRLRRSLLLIAGAVGSVSALAEGLTAVRCAVELFGPSNQAPAQPPVAHPGRSVT
ncbi:DUF5955 family protein [Streptomyces sp. NPDC048717]|uniref:DUF5955 family protein n=1 Tax=unclassified Streptomyces TaxID=2593676 RepID=UPI003412AB29